MRFAEARTAVQEERIVSLARLLCHGHGCGVGKAVVAAHYEGLESVARVENQITFIHLSSRSRFPTPSGLGSRRRNAVAFGYFELDFQLPTAGLRQRILQQLKVIVLKPNLGKFIRHLQGDRGLVKRQGLHCGKPEVVGLGVQQGTDLLRGFRPDFINCRRHRIRLKS